MAQHSATLISVLRSEMHMRWTIEEMLCTAGGPDLLVLKGHTLREQDEGARRAHINRNGACKHIAGTAAHHTAAQGRQHRCSPPSIACKAVVMKHRSLGTTNYSSASAVGSALAMLEEIQDTNVMNSQSFKGLYRAG